MERKFLRPLDAVAGFVPRQFADAVRAEAAALCGREGITVATHNDLTMWNVVLTDRQTLGVLDWEHAAPAGLPLADLFYALVDGVAATLGYRDRRAAFHQCFRRDGARAGWARSIVRANVDALRIDTDLAAAAFRSCWLEHGADEAIRGEGDAFLPILRDLAEAPESYWPVSPHDD
jgi:aminoglycoside phosphotransferase (APT) family kinase protein